MNYIFGEYISHDWVLDERNIRKLEDLILKHIFPENKTESKIIRDPFYEISMSNLARSLLYYIGESVYLDLPIEANEETLIVFVEKIPTGEYKTLIDERAELMRNRDLQSVRYFKNCELMPDKTFKALVITLYVNLYELSENGWIL